MIRVAGNDDPVTTNTRFHATKRHHAVRQPLLRLREGEDWRLDQGRLGHRPNELIGHLPIFGIMYLLLVHGSGIAPGESLDRPIPPGALSGRSVQPGLPAWAGWAKRGCNAFLGAALAACSHDRR